MLGVTVAFRVHTRRAYLNGLGDQPMYALPCNPSLNSFSTGEQIGTRTPERVNMAPMYRLTLLVGFTLAPDTELMK